MNTILKLPFLTASVVLVMAPLARGEPPTAASKPARTDLYGDPLPDGALARMGSVRLYHPANSRPVIRIVFSPDSKLIASEGQGGPIHIWDPASGKELRKIDRDAYGVVTDSIAFSPDGKLFATYRDGAICLEEAVTGRGKLTVRTAGTASYLTFSPDGRVLAALVEADRPAQALVLWDPTTGRELSRIPGWWVPAFSPDGKILATGGADGVVSFRESPGGKVLRQFAAHKRHVFRVWFSPDNKTLVTAGVSNIEGSDVALWEAATGKELRRFHGWSYPVLSPSGKMLAMTKGGRIDRGENAKLLLWDLAAAKEWRTIEALTGSFWAAAFSPDGKTLAATLAGPYIRLWDMTTGEEVPPHRHYSRAPGVTFAPDGKTIATGSHDRTARVWEAATGKQLVCFAEKSPVEGVTYSPDGRSLAAVARCDVSVWDLAGGKRVRELVPHAQKAYSAVFSPDGRLLATRGKDSDQDYSIAVWDVTSGQPVRRIAILPSPDDAVIFARDGKTLMGTEGERGGRAVCVWEIATGTKTRTHPFHRPNAQRARLSPDGRVLATAERNAVHVWEAATGHPLLRLQKHHQEVSEVQFSADRRMLAAADAEVIHVWETASGKELFRFPKPDANHAFVCMAFSPDGERLVSGGGHPLVWDLAPTGWGVARLPRCEPTADRAGFSDS